MGVCVCAREFLGWKPAQIGALPGGPPTPFCVKPGLPRFQRAGELCTPKELKLEYKSGMATQEVPGTRGKNQSERSRPQEEEDFLGLWIGLSSGVLGYIFRSGLHTGSGQVDSSLGVEWLPVCRPAADHQSAAGRI